MSIQTYVIRVEGGLEKDLTALGADIVAVYNEEEPVIANAVSQIFSAFKTTEWPVLLNALISLFQALMNGGLPGLEVAAAVEVPVVGAETIANAEAAAKPVLDATIPEAEAALSAGS